MKSILTDASGALIPHRFIIPHISNTFWVKYSVQECGIPSVSHQYFREKRIPKREHDVPDFTTVY